MSSAVEAVSKILPNWYRPPKSAGEALAYLAECQLATLEGFLMRKGQIGERKRHEQISALAVDAAKHYSTAAERENMKAGRLIEALTTPKAPDAKRASNNAR